MARFLPLGLFAIALSALALAAGAEPASSPAALWRQRMAEARDLKMVIASSAAVLLAFGCALEWRRRGAWLAKSRNAVLAALAIATVFAWWHPYRGSLRAWLHVGDAFHYFMGAKYFDELGYTRLYRCAAIADAEAGIGPLLARSSMRDLATNEIRPVAPVLRHPARCKRHFSAERWQAFGRDLAFFRKKLTVPLWLQLRFDHGYNPPPTWTLAGGLLASTGPASRQQFFVLTAIDPILLTGMFAAVAWAFGWQVMCIALIYWGTNQPAAWEWVGGSILRFDWLAASLVGLCCLRRGRPVAGGIALAWATAVRVFPVVMVAAIALAALLRMGRRLALTPDQRRFALAFGAALALIVALSSLWAGPRSWIDFAENSRLHLTTDTVNRMGLRPLLAYRHDARLETTLDATAKDPYAHWRAERAATGEARWPLRVAIVIGYLALLVLALRGQPDWVAGVLGIGAVSVFSELGSYYFGMLVVFACLAGRRRELGAALVLLAATSWWVGAWGGRDRDVVVALTSLATLIFVAFATLRMAMPGSGPEAGKRPPKEKALAPDRLHPAVGAR